MAASMLRIYCSVSFMELRVRRISPALTGSSEGALIFFFVPSWLLMRSRRDSPRLRLSSKVLFIILLVTRISSYLLASHYT